MEDSSLMLNQTLRSRLSNLVQTHAEGSPAVDWGNESLATRKPHILEGDPSTPVTAVITANEVNQLHGTGPLVKRICKGWRNVFSIRARNDWGGIHEFGDWNVCLHQRAKSRAEFFREILGFLRGWNVQRVLCVPFLQDEFLTAIALQKSFGAKLCAYVMDDQNIASHNIPDALMQEFLECCSLRLITHPELKFAYETKFRLPFHVLPAIVPAGLIAHEATAPAAEGCRRAALLGSFWDQKWFDRLCSVLSGCDCEIDWFGNNKSPWLNFAQGSLASAGIKPHGVIPEHQLADMLKKYPVIIIPVSALDGGDANAGVARLSLPGRILFALATSHTPILIVGDPRTCGARFVNHFDVGEVVPYDSRKIGDAIARMSKPENQTRMRRRAATIAPALSDYDIGDWLARSIELGAPADSRFEEFFAGYDPAIDLDECHGVIKAAAGN